MTGAQATAGRPRPPLAWTRLAWGLVMLGLGAAWLLDRVQMRFAGDNV